MPAGFTKCENAPGHKIRTITGPNAKYKVPAGKYLHICFLPSGKTYRGEIKKKKK
ncbi:MAG: hypothetical protein AAB456_00220 [Patescibacteria group bacterium]